MLDETQSIIESSVAYGADIDEVREALLSVAAREESVCDEPEPRVRFRRFGASGLDFELLCWINEPVLSGRVIDILNSSVYRLFQTSGIEIPYAKQDIYVKELPLS